MNSFTIAVAGKGGVGKTTFAALAIRHLHHITGEVILAVDADPNANLHAKLGTSPRRTIGDIREELLVEADQLPSGVTKQEHVDYQIRLALAEGDGFDLLTMGRQEGPGCYCYVNNILRTFVDSLSERYAYVVIDNEAGMEHLSRRTTRTSDVLFVVSDASKAAADSAVRIAALAKEMDLGIGRTALVRNMLPPDSDGQDAPAGFDAAYAVTASAAIRSGSMRSESLLDIPQHDPTYQDISKALDEERKLARQ
ncbi:MAG: AAA family ATPase [Methanobacteriota archaeon]|nr:MAG: AAA family ATPase [Euryarchaeota archaeon]